MKYTHYFFYAIALFIPFWIGGIIVQGVKQNGFDFFYVGMFIILGIIGVAGTLAFADIFKEITRG